MLENKCITSEGVREETWSVLEAVAREGARKLLQQALENEVFQTTCPKLVTDAVEIVMQLIRRPPHSAGRPSAWTDLISA